MKQSLDLKLGQHLTITPQLQQAIRLLQLSSIELQQEIQEALESNPMLEENERDEEIPDAKNDTELSTTDSADANGEDTGESFDEVDALPATDAGPGEESETDWDET